MLISEVDINNFPEINLFKYKIRFNFIFIDQILLLKKIKDKNSFKQISIIFNSDSKFMLFFKNKNNIFWVQSQLP